MLKNIANLFVNTLEVGICVIILTFVWMQILDAMNQDSGIPLTQLQVDGGMTSNRLLMQLQADILCIPVGEISFHFLQGFRSVMRVELDQCCIKRKVNKETLAVTKLFLWPPAAKRILDLKKWRYDYFLTCDRMFLQHSRIIRRTTIQTAGSAPNCVSISWSICEQDAENLCMLKVYHVELFLNYFHLSTIRQKNPQKPWNVKIQDTRSDNWLSTSLV